MADPPALRALKVELRAAGIFESLLIIVAHGGKNYSQDVKRQNRSIDSEGRASECDDEKLRLGKDCDTGVGLIDLVSKGARLGKPMAAGPRTFC